jgi:hypothetical protein
VYNGETKTGEKEDLCGGSFRALQDKRRSYPTPKRVVLQEENRLEPIEKRDDIFH